MDIESKASSIERCQVKHGAISAVFLMKITIFKMLGKKVETALFSCVGKTMHGMHNLIVVGSVSTWFPFFYTFFINILKMVIFLYKKKS